MAAAAPSAQVLTDGCASVAAMSKRSAAHLADLDPDEQRPARIDATRRLNKTDWRAYDGLAVYAHDEAECWPAQETVAADLGLCREQVNRSIKKLEAAGCLTITKVKREHDWDRNSYELLADYHASDTARRIKHRAARRPRRPEQTTKHLPLLFSVITRRAVGLKDPGQTCDCRDCGRARRQKQIRRPPPPIRPLSWLERRDQEAHYRLIDRWKAEREATMQAPKCWNYEYAPPESTLSEIQR